MGDHPPRRNRCARTVDNGHLTELDLALTVPGSESYNGTVVYEVARDFRDRFLPVRRSRFASTRAIVAIES